MSATTTGPDPSASSEPASGSAGTTASTAGGDHPPERPHATVAAVLLLLALVLGAVVIVGHGVDGLDRHVFALISQHPRSVGWQAVADVGDPRVVAAAAVWSAIMLGARAPARALACLTGPLAAGLLTDAIMKPVIDSIAGGSFQYPSGHTAGIAALASVLVIALPRRWRTWTVLGAAVLLVAGSVAVVMLRWHTATDAIGGCLVGIGAVMLSLALRRPQWRIVGGWLRRLR